MSSQESGRFKWDFLLRLSSSEESTRCSLVDSRSGKPIQAAHGAAFDRKEAASLIAKIRVPGASADVAEQLGQHFSEVAFPAAILDQLLNSALSGPVRLGLNFEPSWLSEAPWECVLVGRNPGIPIGLQPNLHMYRWFDSAAHPIDSSPARRVLLVFADPQSALYPALVNGDRELKSVANAFLAPECKGFEVNELRFATHSSLKRSLADQLPDIVHFIGHGDVQASGGVLVLESDRPHRESLLYAEEFAKLIRSAGTRLVVLSGCFTSGSLCSVGSVLVHAGVEAVVGMQMPISDMGAHLFSRALYASLAEGEFLEVAVDQGRYAIAGAGLDWISPTTMISSHGSFAFSRDVPGEVSSQGPPRHNIPIEERPFVGRAKQRETLADTIQRSGSRLVTITGMGGMGKTRLAKRVALDLADRFEDGAWLIECEALTLGEELVTSIAGAIGLEASSVSEPALLEALTGKELLLVFDCFERIAGSAGIFPKILQMHPGIKILVTSRVLLGVKYEREFTLDPMSLKRTRAQVAESLVLFEEAVTYADPTFKLSRKNQKLVEAIVHDLEAVPLAIVLAAGRLRHMSLEELAERVRTRKLEVLKRKPTGPDDRHADLLRVVGDSLSLLFEDDRRLVKTLSVFQGGFFQDDALAVIGTLPNVLDGISLLRDNSLLMSQIVNSRMRFRILDTIREFLDLIPDDEDVKEMRGRHAHHFATLAEEIRELFNRGEYGQAREQLSLNVGNYRVGVEWAVSTRNVNLIRTYAHSLARVYFETGAQQEFDMLASSAEAIATEEDLQLLREIYGLQGEKYRRNNRSDEAIEVWQRRVKICIQLGDLNERVDTLFEIARLALVQGNYPVAVDQLGEFTRLRPQLSDVSLLATGMALQAQLQMQLQGPVEALELCRELEEMMKPVAVDRQALYIWQSLARLYREMGALSDALRIANRFLGDALKSSHLMTAGQALLELSQIHEMLEDVDRAARLIAIACAIPPSVSPSLREQVQARRSEFANGPYRELLNQAIIAVGKTEWEALAWREVPQSAQDTKP